MWGVGVSKADTIWVVALQLLSFNVGSTWRLKYELTLALCSQIFAFVSETFCKLIVQYLARARSQKESNLKPIPLETPDCDCFFAGPWLVRPRLRRECQPWDLT